jgi:hypothetical protein
VDFLYLFGAFQLSTGWQIPYQRQNGFLLYFLRPTWALKQSLRTFVLGRQKFFLHFLGKYYTYHFEESSRPVSGICSCSNSLKLCLYIGGKLALPFGCQN